MIDKKDINSILLGIKKYKEKWLSWHDKSA